MEQRPVTPLNIIGIFVVVGTCFVLAILGFAAVSLNVGFRDQRQHSDNRLFFEYAIQNLDSTRCEKITDSTTYNLCQLFVSIGISTEKSEVAPEIDSCNHIASPQDKDLCWITNAAKTRSSDHCYNVGNSSMQSLCFEGVRGLKADRYEFAD